MPQKLYRLNFKVKKPILILFLSLIGINLILFSLLFSKSAPKDVHNLTNEYTSCLTSGSPQQKGQCLKALAIKALQNYTPAEVEEATKLVTDSSLRQWCHEFMHYSGWEVYRKSNSLYQAFEKASSECDSGMFHGIVEEYINQTQNNDPEKFLAQIPKVCEEEGMQNLPSGKKGICYHGLGHGFMLLTDNDLNEALKYCDRLSDSGMISCYTGAFMENTQSKQVGKASHPSKFSFDLNNPDFPCNSLDEKYLEQCYIYKGISNVVQTQGDFKLSFQKCLDIQNPKGREKCFWGVGSDISGPHWSTQTAAQKCQVALEISSQAYEQCIWGAMSFVAQLNLGDPKAAVEFCQVIDEDYLEVCYKAAGNSLTGWVSSDEPIESKCQVFQDPQAISLCLNPGRI